MVRIALYAVCAHLLYYNQYDLLEIERYNYSTAFF